MKDINFLTDEPIVTVEQIVGWEYALDAARFTMGKELICKKPSEAFIKKSIIRSAKNDLKTLYICNTIMFR